MTVKFLFLNLCILFLCLGQVSLGCSVLAKDQAMLKVDRLKQEIKVGMSRSQVEKIFHSNDLGYTYVPADELGQFEIPRKPDSYYQNLKGRYLSMIRESGGRGIIRKDISIEVDIGQDGRVSNVRIEAVYTGP